MTHYDRHAQPALTAIAQNWYRCTDIETLHRWLEDHGYEFYGVFEAGEYGRFSHQEAEDRGDRRRYVHSFIQVLRSGEIYAPDGHATELLDSLTAGPPRERTA
ncbi:MAG: hypothetical protein IPO81_23525 [Kouleothrix sp.]|nr:hypothetical protein [Kouleothrix sp.]